MENAKKTRNDTWPSPVANAKTVTQQYVAFTGGEAVVHAKTVTQQHVAFTSGTHQKTVTQQRVAFTGGTRKKQPRSNALLSPVIYRNSYPTIRCLDQRSRNNNMSSSPAEITKNGANTTGRLHQRNTTTTTQQHVAFTGGIPQ